MKKILAFTIFILVAIPVTFVSVEFLMRDTKAKVPVNLVERAKYFDRLASENDADAIFELAMLYGRGEGVSLDPDETIKLIKKSAYLGDWRALINLSRYYEFGKAGASGFIVIKPDAKLAEKYHEDAIDALNKAADSGDISAIETSAKWHDYGDYGVEKDPMKAVALYEKLLSIVTENAANGNSDAQLLLSRFYERGEAGLVKDESKAKYWLKKAADNENPKAIFEISQRDDTSVEDSAILLNKSARLGFHQAMIYLGFLYAKKDEAKVAIKWFKMAYEQAGYDSRLATYIADQYEELQDSSNTLEWRFNAAARSNNSLDTYYAYNSLWSEFEKISDIRSKNNIEEIARTGDYLPEVEANLLKIYKGEYYLKSLRLLERFSSHCDESNKSTEYQCKAREHLKYIETTDLYKSLPNR